jgi:Mn2+/Fe2+ NRAMP family transporter
MKHFLVAIALLSCSLLVLAYGGDLMAAPSDPPPIPFVLDKYLMIGCIAACLLAFYRELIGFAFCLICAAARLAFSFMITPHEHPFDGVERFVIAPLFFLLLATIVSILSGKKPSEGHIERNT